jgi:predicted DNA-binding protein YlxM (UPF0122 family)
MITNHERWIQVKNDPQKYAELKQSINRSRQKKRDREKQAVLDVRAQAFLSEFYNWDIDKHELTETQYRALSLYYGLDEQSPISIPKIAEMLGVSKQCIASKRDRAIKHLMKLKTKRESLKAEAVT